MIILLTGGTGFLGSYLLPKLIDKADKLYLLVRSKHAKKYKKKFEKFPNVQVVVGDISNPDIIDDTRNLAEICSEVTSIIHAAAYYDLEGGYPSCFMYNVVGTQNILYLSRLCKKLESFHYVSTVAVAGSHPGQLLEDELDCGQKYSNHYAKTKSDAEHMVRDWKLNNVKKRIYRLGILVGDSVEGVIPKLDGPYYFFKILGKYKNSAKMLGRLGYLPLPFDKRAFFPLIPVDHAANFLSEAVVDVKGHDRTRTYHVVSDQCPTVGEFVEDALSEFGIKLKAFPIPKNKLNKLLMKQIGLPKELLDYMYSTCRYDRANIVNDFPDLEKSLYSNYKSVFFDYAKEVFSN